MSEIDKSISYPERTDYEALVMIWDIVFDKSLSDSEAREALINFPDTRVN